MKSLYAILIICLLSVVGQAQVTREAIQGYCERGGEAVITDGRTSATRVQRTFSSCSVTVLVAGTQTPAVIYNDNTGAPKSNPFVADTDGYWKFYAGSGRYDVRFSGAGIPTPLTRSGYWVSSGGAGGVPICDAGKMLFYATSGAAPACLTLGTGLQIQGTTLSSTGGGGGGSGTILAGTGNTFPMYSGTGTTLASSPLSLDTSAAIASYRLLFSGVFDVRHFNTRAILSPTFYLERANNTGANAAINNYALHTFHDFAGGSHTLENVGVYANLNLRPTATVPTASGFLSRIEATGATSTTISGFRSVYSQTNATGPATFYSFLSEAPSFTAGSMNTFTAFYAQAPATLTNITNYRSFHSTGGSVRFEKLYANDTIDLWAGMPLRLYAPAGGTYAAWAFPGATTSYTYFLPVSAPEPGKLLKVDTISSGNVYLTWAMGNPMCTANQILYYQSNGGVVDTACLTVGQNLTITGGVLNAQTGAGASVTSVGLAPAAGAADDIFSVSNSPITLSGNLILGVKTQQANKIFAGPVSGANTAPTFRSLVAADIPNLGAIYQPFASNLSTLGSLEPVTNNFILGSAGNWITASPSTVRTILSINNVENTALSTWTGTSTITTLGTIATGTWNGTAISPAKGGAAGLTGVLKATSGVVSAAVSGTDFAPASSGSTASLLAPNGTGGFSNVVVGSGLNLSGGTLTSTAGGGSVTSVSVVANNGITQSVTNATSTPQITLGLGAITPTSVNGIGITGVEGKTLTVNNSVTLAASADGASLNIGAGGTLGSSAYTSTGAYFPATGGNLSNTVVTRTVSAPTLLGVPTGTIGTTTAPANITLGANLDITSNILNVTLTTLSQAAGLVLASPPTTTGTPSWIKITGDHITDGSIVSNDLQDLSVKSAKINSNAITNTHIADSAISGTKLTDATVGLAKLTTTGIASNTTYLRGDGVWSTISAGGGGVGNTGNGYIPYNLSGTFASSPLQVGGGTVTLTRTGLTNNALATLFTLTPVSSGSSQNNFGGSIDFNLNYGLGSSTLASRIMTSVNSISNQSSRLDFLTYFGAFAIPMASMYYDDTTADSVLKVGGSMASASAASNPGSIILTDSSATNKVILRAQNNAQTISNSSLGGQRGLMFPVGNSVLSNTDSYANSSGVWWVPTGTAPAALAGLYVDRRGSGGSPSSSVHTGLIYAATESSLNRFLMTKPADLNNASSTKAIEIIAGSSTDQNSITLFPIYSTNTPPVIRLHASNTAYSGSPRYVGLAGPTDGDVDVSTDYNLPAKRPTSAAVMAVGTNYKMFWRYYSGDEDTVNGGVLGTSRPVLTSVTFASLNSAPTPGNGAIAFCSDCERPAVAGNACGSGSGGAFAVKINGTWRCY